MKVEGKVRIVAGLMVLISFTLGRLINPLWLWLSVFVGLNLIQSAFTGFCPAERFFKAISK
ncbi:MAG: DUF2892 domain-containing protein [Kiritimatiellae bacterium]|jgi:hypothetical protein|nr:DUF2892 domain-containing protein [Kiritimatiellia bacterium]